MSTDKEAALLGMIEAKGRVIAELNLEIGTLNQRLSEHVQEKMLLYGELVSVRFGVTRSTVVRIDSGIPHPSYTVAGAEQAARQVEPLPGVFSWKGWLWGLQDGAGIVPLSVHVSNLPEELP